MGRTVQVLDRPVQYLGPRPRSPGGEPLSSQYADAMVDVGVSELRRSRERLAKQGESAEQAGDCASGGLLFFYAAECG